MNEIQAVKTAKIEEVKKNSKKGFTLVELVVVIAILAILAAIAIPVVSSTIASSQRSTALSNAQTLELALKEAHAQAIAKDTSVFTDGLDTTVAVVIDKKALKLEDTVKIDNKDYVLQWSKTDSKCYYVYTAASGGTSECLGETSVPSGTLTTLVTSGTTSQKLSDLF
ncbi:prepilin-type N-terminal cleavage/methylation domain-containing protein [Ruminococcus sp.]|uniref:prepilin-type N-terminal cleavage/methylation domain-containing protein n=1 Tax=Ruminococcus sp. TaxID=41978 RepID=UPI00386C74FF